MDLYILRHEQQTGPYTEAAVRALVGVGEIECACLVWLEGMPEWQPLDQVLDLDPPSPPGLPPAPARSWT